MITISKMEKQIAGDGITLFAPCGESSQLVWKYPGTAGGNPHSLSLVLVELMRWWDGKMILLNCSSFGIAHLFSKCWLHESSSEKAEDRNVVRCHTSGKRNCSEAAALGLSTVSGLLECFFYELLLTSFRDIYLSLNAFFKCVQQMSIPKHNMQ